MTTRLHKTASGERHLFWVREIHATLNAQLSYNSLLTEEQRDALRAETQKLTSFINTLADKQAQYRLFLDGAYVTIRAEQRVADYLCDQAQRDADGQLRPYRTEIEDRVPDGYSRVFSGLALSRILRAGTEKTALLARTAADVLRSMPASIKPAPSLANSLQHAGELLDQFNKKRIDEIDPKRLPLRLATERAVLELREFLEQMDGRLRTHFTSLFIESLYPDPNADRADVEDDEDPTPTPTPAPT